MSDQHWSKLDTHCAKCARPIATEAYDERHGGECERPVCWCESYCWEVNFSGECYPTDDLLDDDGFYTDLGMAVHVRAARERIEALEAELAAERAETERIRALLNPDLTFRDVEMKIRDGSIDVQSILGDGSRPVFKWLAALLLHVILGEGDQPPQEPPNYMSGEFSITPAESFENITVAFEVIKPGGKSSHKLRMEAEAALAAHRAARTPQETE